MESSGQHISAYAVIQNNKALKNGTLVFENNEPGTGFLKTLFESAFKIDYPRFYKMDALGKLGIITTDLLLKDADITKNYKPEEIGIVLSNCNASIEADVKYFESAKSFPSPSLFVYTLPNIVIGEISIRHQLKGENAFFVSETFDAGFLYFYVNDLFSRQKIKTCICGWIDVFNEELDACLFLIEQKAVGINFTPGNLERCYKEHIKI